MLHCWAINNQWVKKKLFCCKGKHCSPHLLCGIWVKIFIMNRYISKSYTTSKNTIDRQYTERGQLVVSTITGADPSSYGFTGGNGPFKDDTVSYGKELCGRHQTTYFAWFEREDAHIEEDLFNVSKWCCQNYLLLKPDKTKLQGRVVRSWVKVTHVYCEIWSRIWLQKQIQFNSLCLQFDD